MFNARSFYSDLMDRLENAMAKTKITFELKHCEPCKAYHIKGDCRTGGTN